MEFLDGVGGKPEPGPQNRGARYIRCLRHTALPRPEFIPEHVLKLVSQRRLDVPKKNFWDALQSKEARKSFKRLHHERTKTDRTPYNLICIYKVMKRTPRRYPFLGFDTNPLCFWEKPVFSTWKDLQLQCCGAHISVWFRLHCLSVPFAIVSSQLIRSLLHP